MRISGGVTALNRRSLANTAVALGLVASLIGCTARDSGALTDVGGASAQSDSIAERGPGTIVTATPMNDVDVAVGRLGGKSFRVTYRSTSGISGKPTEVTGAVFVPPGKPPHGGWPILAFAHGTIGINPECSPSRTPDLLKSISLVATYLQLGYAIAAPDYEGLGGPGFHPYLDAKTGGLNLIDAVRALRAVSPDVSKRWGALGGSQGGAVTWAANEQATTYAPELDLVGAVALAPLADVTGFVEKATDRTLTKDQEGVYIWTLMGIERTRPGFPIDAFRHGSTAPNWTRLSQCTDAGQADRNAALFAVTPDDLVPSDTGSSDQLHKILEAMALPQQRTAAPMLVIYGGRDTYVDAEWTRLAVERACALGSRIAAVYQPDKGHTDLDPGQFSGWLMSRFDGLPAPSTCAE